MKKTGFKKVEKRVEKPLKKPLKSGSIPPKLTENEIEVLSLLTDEFLTVKQVSTRRKCSVQAVYSIRKNLIKKGVLNALNQRVEKKGGCFKPNPHQIRLHNEQYNIKIIWSDERYRERLKKGNTKFQLDGNTIMLFRDNIQIYSNTSFFGDSPTESNAKASKYWTRIINQLQTETKTILLKQRSQNITRVRSEYAEVGNEFANKCIKEHDKIRIIGEDGKVWLLVDNSFNFNELETVHPKHSHQDMEDVVQPFFQDLRENNPPTLSKIMSLIEVLAKQNIETATGLNAVVKLLNLENNKNLDDDKTQTKLPNYIG